MVVRKNTDPPPVELAKIIIRKPVLISVAVFVVTTIIVIILSFKHYNITFGENILVEAHGMLFDILIIGILILFLNKLAEKRITIQRYLDEIDDFRGWNSDEAAHRILGNIKRLNRLNKTDIDINSCYLKKVLLKEVCLNGATLDYTNFTESVFEDTDLSGSELCSAIFNHTDFLNTNLAKSELYGASFTKACIRNTNFHGANLCRTDFTEVDFSKAKISNNVNFNEAILKKTNFTEVDLSKANLNYADLSEAKLRDADLRNANLYNANLSKAYLYGAKLNNIKLGIETNFKEADLCFADLSEAHIDGSDGICLTPEEKTRRLFTILLHAKALYRATLNPDVEKELREKGYQHLFDKPALRGTQGEHSQM